MSLTRYLITTADERSWKFDQPVLFLGKWCHHFNRRHLWSNLNFIIAEPYGLGSKEKYKNTMMRLSLEKRILSVLSSFLNSFHGTHHSIRYWNILLGHWLRRYLDLIINRYYTLESCLGSHEIHGTTI